MASHATAVSNKRSYGSAWAARSRRATMSGTGLSIAVPLGSGEGLPAAAEIDSLGCSPGNQDPAPPPLLHHPSTASSGGSADAHFPAAQQASTPRASSSSNQGSCSFHERSSTTASGAGDSETLSQNSNGPKGSQQQPSSHQQQQQQQQQPVIGLPAAALRSPTAARPFSPLGRGPGGGFPTGAAANTNSSTGSGGPVKWKRTLYEKQPFDDNYVDPERFLGEMRKNAFIREYPYLEIVRDMFALVQQVSITAIVAVVYYAIHEQWISRKQMMFLNVVLLLSSLFVYIAIHRHRRQQALLRERQRQRQSHTDPHSNHHIGATRALQQHQGSGAAAPRAAQHQQQDVLSNSSERRETGSSNQQQPRRKKAVGEGGEEAQPLLGKRGNGINEPLAEGVSTLGEGSQQTTSPATAAATNSQHHYEFLSLAKSDDDITVFGCLRQGVIFTIVLLLLSPIFKTLTQTYTDDTIRALCIALLFVHNVFADYNYINGYKQKFELNIAVNAALTAAVLLASRIQSPAYASMFFAFGVQCFALSPLFRHLLKQAAIEAHVALTFTLCGIAIGCLLSQSPLLASVFVIGVLMLIAVIPWAFVTMQRRYKFQINGPWDEARPMNSAAAAEWANSGLLS